MILIPAMDIRCGQFAHVLSENICPELQEKEGPVEIAAWLKEQGADYLHITDLDGSFTGNPDNLEVAVDVIKATGLKIQFGGGIRSIESIEKAFSMGIDRVVMSADTILDEDILEYASKKYGDKITVRLETKKNKVVDEGWQQLIGHDVLNVAKKLEEKGFKRIIINDVLLEGSLAGPNLELVNTIIKKTGLKVLLAGGISSLEDISKLEEICKSGCGLGIEGAIVGKAFYVGNITFTDAKRICELCFK